jgi:hypothetical protein
VSKLAWDSLTERFKSPASTIGACKFTNCLSRKETEKETKKEKEKEKKMQRKKIPRQHYWRLQIVSINYCQYLPHS